MAATEAAGAGAQQTQDNSQASNTQAPAQASVGATFRRGTVAEAPEEGSTAHVPSNNVIQFQEPFRKLSIAPKQAVAFPPEVIGAECCQKLWITELTLETEPEPCRLPVLDQANLGGIRKHGFFGMTPSIITGKDIAPDISRYRRQFVPIDARAYTNLPILEASTVQQYMKANIPTGPFSLEAHPSSTGKFIVPERVHWGIDLQKPTAIKRWVASFGRFGVLVCHRMKIPSTNSTSDTGFDHQVVFLNPNGETAVWPNMESTKGDLQMAAPFRTLLQNPQVLKIDCDTDNPGQGYFTTVLPSTVSSALMFKLFFPSNIASYEDFAATLGFQGLSPKPEDGLDPKRIMFSVQMVRLTMLALLNRVCEVHSGDLDPKELNVAPYLREMVVTALSIKNPRAVVAMPAESFQYPLPTAHQVSETTPNLAKMLAFLDSTDIVMRYRDLEVSRATKIATYDPNLRNLKDCQAFAEKIWMRIPLPLPSTIFHLDVGNMPHFCVRCGDPLHREIHCTETISYENKCRYPMCRNSMTHVTKVCPILHSKCSTCLRRGHCHTHHSVYSPVQLDAIFCWWSPQGAYTCLVFLEASKFRKAQLHDWHWIAYLHSVQRNACQLLMASLTLPFVLLPNPPKLHKEIQFIHTPLWQFPPYLHKKVVTYRREREEEQARKDAEAAAEKKRLADQRVQEEIDALVTNPVSGLGAIGIRDAAEQMEEDQVRANTPPPSEIPLVNPGTFVFNVQGQEKFDAIQKACRLADACTTLVGAPTSKTVIALQSCVSAIELLVSETKSLYAANVQMEQRHQAEICALRQELQQIRATPHSILASETVRVKFAPGATVTPIPRPESPFDLMEELTGRRSRSPHRNAGNNKRARSQTPSQGYNNYRGGNPKRGRNNRSRSRSRSRNRHGNNQNNWSNNANNSDNSNNSNRGRGRGGRNKRGGRGRGRGNNNSDNNQNNPQIEPKVNTGANIFYYQGNN